MSELPTRPAVRILRAEQADLWIDGYAFLQAARDQAEAIRQDSERWLQQAHAEGFESGRQEGAEQVSALLGETSLKVDAWLAGLETSLADLALGIVREILDDMNDAERVVRCTRKALGAFRQDQALTLFVSRQDAEAVRQQLKLQARELPAIAVEPDDRLQGGQARLSSPVGSVELGLEAQLLNLRRNLLPFADEAQP
ncbi:type III secretion system stator protein SctL [Pseudomonas mucidolens]|uniref:Type 3 secretion system stator protein n=1 Tax=Pseudomonas mucidolens TaxID=46679 RepID=A0A1H2MV15_9PSED|nr:type III secretion system stator protein SctL [Pseudomonas mucidolens]SDU97069.1 type III secretion protein L [Pseudomonas mucidolens]SQH33162.1 type III secretion component [Pseudomonas mucidolens]